MISKYLFFVVGEDATRISGLHRATIKRTKTFALAIHIPVLLWACTGLVIAFQIFKIDLLPSILIAAFCSTLIYLVERLVLATPESQIVNIGRVFIGLIISLLGASAVDLVIFDREVFQQLKEVGITKIKKDFEEKISIRELEVNHKKVTWLKGQDEAKCEANGTCGSKTRSVGPVYRELSRHAEILRVEYAESQNRLNRLNEEEQVELTKWRTTSEAGEQAGLLARIEALHQYTNQNTFALIGWLLFFFLILSLELMVIAAKWLSTSTVDDELDKIREDISLYKARAYKEAISSPVANAKNLLASSYE